MNSKEIYTTIYKLYEISNEQGRYNQRGENTHKSTIRQMVNRYLKKEYPGKTWNELSPLEQMRFTHIVMKQPLFSYHVQDPAKQKKIEKKIQKEISATFLETDIELKKQNEKNLKIMKQYYVESDTEQEKRESYKQFREDYENIIKVGTPPTYEEWTKTPLRLYDYIESQRMEDDLELIHEEKPVPQEKINDTIIKTILKIFKVEFKIEIDMQRITDCLTFLHNYERGDEFGTQIIDYDPTLPLSKEEQQKIFNMNREYQRYTMMLDNLDFYKKEKA